MPVLRLCLLLLIGAVLSSGDELPESLRRLVDHHIFKTSVGQVGNNYDKTFPLRYAVVTRFWDPQTGPIFFYCGHELTLEHYINNTGWMWDSAEEFKAMLVFAEHRFYGKSYPRDHRKYTNETYRIVLTTEQVLADYAKLLMHIKIEHPLAEKAPVIAIGGFYGGMLATYFRLKYSHLVTGALASSAPVLMFPGMVPCHAFDYRLTSAFRHDSEECEQAIRDSWPLLYDQADTDHKAVNFYQLHGVCQAITTRSQGLFWEWMRETYINLAMYNYPERATRVRQLPAYPIAKACEVLTTAKDNASLVEAVFKIVHMFYNQTGDVDCYDILEYFKGNPIWAFQMCTELITTQCSDGYADMLYARQWNLKKFRESCQQRFGVKPEPRKLYETYGTRFLTYSNIIFSNGEFDPWTSLGYVLPGSETVIPILIRGGAHQQDLCFASPLDSRELVRARKEEKKHILKWVDEARMREDVPTMYDSETERDEL
ncbi:unnamed protein product [Ixodes hexagonus]